jgi:NADPH:quinone reductase-like Zn-dependent oxidoreductase/acyl carrier protein
LQSCDDVLALVQTLAGMGYRDAPRLWLVTRGAQAVGGGDPSLMQAPILGLGRVIGMEHAEWRCARVDLDAARPEGEAEALAAELLGDDAEEETAWRSSVRHVARLLHQTPRVERTEHLERDPRRPYQVENDGTGSLDHLVLRATERRDPGPGEVELAIEAAALGFRDVLLAFGLAPMTPAEVASGGSRLGSECAGTIKAVGEGVEGLSVGQRVIALAPGGLLASHATVPAALVLGRPSGVEPAEAAALLLSHATAWHALEELGQLQRGERVLIHGAASEVGLAALHWARHVGARIFATAGTPARRAYLQSLGVEGVGDSHSDAFVGAVRDWSGGEGVDVVLNPLSDDPLSCEQLGRWSLGTMRPGGRLVELSGREYRVEAPSAGGDAAISVLRADLCALAAEQPARLRSILEKVVELIEAKAIAAPMVEKLAVSEAASALRRMALSQHVGQVVLTFDEAEPEIRVPDAPAFTVRPDGSYLVTGGLGGLGLSVAGLLAERGAGQLILVGRSGVTQPAQQEAIKALQARGTRVTVVQADVADEGQLERLLGDVAASGLPLRGVIHAAGVLDDGFLPQQTPERFRKVMAPKVLGAWNLHRLTEKVPLDFFVMYASASGLFGSPGQGNYAAANTFLDALAHHRRAHGMPGLSVDWGPFSEVGLAAAQENRAARMATRGMRILTPDEGLTALSTLLDARRVQTAVLSLDVRQWLEFYPAAANSRTLSKLVTAGAEGAGRQAGDRAVLDRLAAAPADERAGVMEELLRKQVSQVLRIGESKVDAQSPLTSLGMDSLMGLELRNRIETLLGVKMPATILWTYPTVAALSVHLLGELGLAEVAPEPDKEAQDARAAQEAAASAESELAGLDQDDLLAALDAALEKEKNR